MLGLEGQGVRIQEKQLRISIRLVFVCMFLITCSVLGFVCNAVEGSPPLLSDSVQSAGRQLGLNLQVERAEESLPDGLQRLTLVPEYPIVVERSALVSSCSV